ncbi:putative 25S rRNA (uracil(2843)-N(3))-methyltransferase [Microsporum ferrugineum]
MPKPRPQARKTTKAKKSDTLSQRTLTDPSISIEDAPILLQQLVLDIFASRLTARPATEHETTLTLKEQVQTIKSYLFNRDFSSAFTDASSDMLRAYALRWSAGRALAYTGIFEAVLRLRSSDSLAWPPGLAGYPPVGVEGIRNKHILCIGGGAGAEVVALAAAIRWAVGLDDPAGSSLNLSVTALDVADWQPVIDGLLQGCTSESIHIKNPGFQLPLLKPGDLAVSFQKEDVLALSEEQLSRLVSPPTKEVTNLYGGGEVEPQRPKTVLITLMFTLNELFSTSLSDTVAMLLRLTDITKPGAVLLVVDSPGSYSTLSLGPKGARSQGEASSGDSITSSTEEEKRPERKYPMRFLLDHTLLTTAIGCWECFISEESRWFRRDRTGLVYNVGENIGLEDMRYQVHAYRRTAAP